MEYQVYINPKLTYQSRLLGFSLKEAVMFQWELYDESGKFLGTSIGKENKAFFVSREFAIEDVKREISKITGNPLPASQYDLGTLAEKERVCLWINGETGAKVTKPRSKGYSGIFSPTLETKSI